MQWTANLALQHVVKRNHEIRLLMWQTTRTTSQTHAIRRIPELAHQQVIGRVHGALSLTPHRRLMGTAYRWNRGPVSAAPRCPLLKPIHCLFRQGRKRQLPVPGCKYSRVLAAHRSDKPRAFWLLLPCRRHDRGPWSGKA